MVLNNVYNTQNGENDKNKDQEKQLFVNPHDMLYKNSEQTLRPDLDAWPRNISTTNLSFGTTRDLTSSTDTKINSSIKTSFMNKISFINKLQNKQTEPNFDIEENDGLAKRYVNRLSVIPDMSYCTENENKMDDNNNNTIELERIDSLLLPPCSTPPQSALMGKNQTKSCATTKPLNRLEFSSDQDDNNTISMENDYFDKYSADIPIIPTGNTAKPVVDLSFLDLPKHDNIRITTELSKIEDDVERIDNSKLLGAEPPIIYQNTEFMFPAKRDDGHNSFFANEKFQNNTDTVDMLDEFLQDRKQFHFEDENEGSIINEGLSYRESVLLEDSFQETPIHTHFTHKYKNSNAILSSPTKSVSSSIASGKLANIFNSSSPSTSPTATFSNHGGTKNNTNARHQHTYSLSSQRNNIISHKPSLSASSYSTVKHSPIGYTRVTSSTFGGPAINNSNHPPNTTLQMRTASSSPIKGKTRRLSAKLSLSNISFISEPDEQQKKRDGIVDFSYVQSLQKNHSPSKSVNSSKDTKLIISQPSTPIENRRISNFIKINLGDINLKNRKTSLVQNSELGAMKRKTADEVIYKEPYDTSEHVNEGRSTNTIFVNPQNVISNTVNKRINSENSNSSEESTFPNILVSEYDKEKWKIITDPIRI
ncbi:uncharacterized protein SCODWIG_00202 [Saccharomycodes ludwigii]|uniref:Uncharacterized protein n=1 Tax=Saccharomycodes ludwigii TaxID=36035 RepID=A0A376B1C2_9ASCO|nr:hypothetical protein SCDLUD_003571 [Saccharomycodes ludwigii]KAH3900579.1 hypothetical protein SCDLUD_003571 [Saccharomycodes ludwigii]SSD58441.1 uncharacterized protein SCODWIG_00202 [Saccharomycodes ludwigii]